MLQLVKDSDSEHSAPGTSDHEVWSALDADSVVYINRHTLARLQQDVVHASDSGVEIGGILLGRRQEVDQHLITLVEGFETFHCSPNGQLYRVSRSDAFRFRSALDRRESDPNRRLSAVGYFRSQLGEGLTPSSDDEVHVRRFSLERGSVFLLLKALPGGNCQPAVFFSPTGSIHPELPPPVVPKRDRSWSKTLEIVSALLAIAVIAIVANHLSQSLRPVFGAPASGRRPAALALRIEPGPAAITIRWDQNSKAVLSAKRAILYIQDGAQDQSVSLNANMLRTGAFSYRPNTSSVDFDLRVYGGEGAIAREMIHTFVPVPTEADRAQPFAVRPAPVPKVVSNQEVKPKLTPPALPANVRPEPVPLPQPALDHAVPDNPIAQLPASSLPAWPTPSEPALVSPPRVESHAPPPPPALQQVPPPPPAPQQIKTRLQPQTTTYIGPQVIRRVAPSISRQVLYTLTGDVDIDVRVAIDESGKVTRAEVASARGSAHALVSKEAVRAAQLFQFRPARRNNLPVPSEMIVSFRFARMSP